MEYRELYNGVKIPMLGIGVYQVPEYEDAKQTVLTALKAGYRLIDTAQSYMNEQAVGDAIKESGIPREEIFITTKLWIQDFSYEFFKSQGAVVVNEATDFAGTNGCYLYQGRDVQERKNKHLKDQILVLAPSEGLVSSDTWLRCRKKLMANKTFQGGRKAKNTWLAGKVKCGRCGYALMSVGNPTGVQYLRCSKRADSKSCDGCGTLRTREFESFLYGEMVKKLSEFQTLTAKREKVNPKLTALNMELARVEDEIEKLLNTLTGANAVLLSYANSKIEELDTHRQALTKEIAALSAETMSPEQIERLSVYLNQWKEIDFEDRRQVADGLISQIRATDEHVSIEWKI